MLPGETRWEGGWIADEPTGRGVMTFVNGEVFEGEVAAGRRVGRGVLRWALGYRTLSLVPPLSLRTHHACTGPS